MSESERRRRERHPKRSTPLMQEWRGSHPEKAAEAREREDAANAAVNEMATRRKRQWDSAELRFVRDHPDLSHREIASRLGRTVRSVEGVRRRWRL